MAKLTQTFAMRVKAPTHGYQIHYDGGLRGFGLRVTCNGAKSFVLNYRAHGRERRYTIGQMGAWTAETARTEAQRLRSLVDQGEDPFVAAEAQKLRAIEEEARQRTLKELADYYLSNHAEVHKRRRSIAEDKSMLDSIVLPRLGRLRISSISRRDIAELHTELKGTPYRANRVLALIHKMFSFAGADDTAEWGTSSNPAAGIPRFHEERRERWLSEDELQRLADAMEKYPDRCAKEAKVSEKQKAFLRAEAHRAVDAVRLVMITGCRKGEALTSKWVDFDLQRGVWTKPSHHTKQNRTEHVPLNDQALSLLESLPRDTDYLFPGRTGPHLRDLKGAWAEVCTLAKLEGVRIHDLRHSFASHLVSSGVSLPIIGKLLGHTQPQTTARYAHLADSPLREAANRFPVLFSMKAKTAIHEDGVETTKRATSRKKAKAAVGSPV